MGLRSLFKRVTDKFSGEYSAAQADIRPDDGASAAGGDVKVTRARLKRPKDAQEEAAEKAKGEH
jgi:hypothetical protein